MPDLNDDLFRSFRTEGSPVTPLPATEVRRRGDRMRRRNNTLAAVGGVAAALVVIATPLAIITQQGTDEPSPPIATQTPDAPDVSWLQEIPADVDVSADIQGADTSQDPETTARPGVSTVELCGTTAFDATAGTVDLAGATYGGEPNSENPTSRTLALYPDDAAAQAALADLQDATTQCTATTGPSVGDSTRVKVDASQLPADESFVVTQGFYGDGDEFPTLGVDYYVVARVGNAVLVTEHATTAQQDDDLQTEQDAVTDVVRAMSVFSPEAD